MNHVLNNNKDLCFTQKHSVAKLLPSRQLMNVLPRLKFLNAITAFTCLTSFFTKSFTTNKIYLYRAHSGFELESPVHIRIWTWNAGNNMYTILESYLQNPYQVLRIKDRSPINNESKWGLVKHGVPQGFNLGPLFFLLYIRNLPKVTNYWNSIVNSKTILFVDDTSIIVNHHVIAGVQFRLFCFPVCSLKTELEWYSWYS